AFLAKTQGMDGQLFYTSGAEAYDDRVCQGYKPVLAANIAGQAIGSQKCMNIWGVKKEDRKLASINACRTEAANHRKGVTKTAVASKSTPKKSVAKNPTSQK